MWTGRGEVDNLECQLVTGASGVKPQPRLPKTRRRLTMADCGRGWARRCAEARGTRCRCKCGGENHGKALQKAQAKDDLRDEAQPQREEALQPALIQ